jgi:hypothetical protein
MQDNDVIDNLTLRQRDRRQLGADNAGYVPAL